MLSEDKFLQKLFPQLSQDDNLIVPPGDDCAVYRVPGSDLLQVIAVDQVIEGRHYVENEDPIAVGRKLLSRNLSDIAAMGALPRYCLLSLATAPDENWLTDFHRGVLDCAKEFGVLLIGGDLAVNTGPAVCSLTIIGETKESQLVRRTGARQDDVLLATGHFGNSFLSQHHLTFKPRLKEGQWLANQTGVHAMMDVTDGLVKDALRMADPSNLSLHFNSDTIPLRQGADIQMALNDGEDYELIIAVSADHAEKILADWPFADTVLSTIAFFRRESKVEAYDETGTPLSGRAPGYDHFK